MLAGEFHYMCYFGLCDLICKDPTEAYAILMDVKHYICGVFLALVEKPLQNQNNKFHRSEVVIEQENFVKAGLFCARANFRADTRSGIAILVIVLIIRHHAHIAAQKNALHLNIYYHRQKSIHVFLPEIQGFDISTSLYYNNFRHKKGPALMHRAYFSRKWVTEG